MLAGPEDVIVNDVSRQPAAPQPTSDTAAVRRRIGTALICAAAVLIGWTCWLGATLPASALPQTLSTQGAGVDNWRLTWVGLDILEIAGLLATGIALRRRHWTATVSALVSLPLFVLDAWFDVTTTATSSELRQAVAMALLVELPTAMVLAWVARSDLQRLRAAANHDQPLPGASTTREHPADAVQGGVVQGGVVRGGAGTLRSIRHLGATAAAGTGHGRVNVLSPHGPTM